MLKKKKKKEVFYVYIFYLYEAYISIWVQPQNGLLIHLYCYTPFPTSANSTQHSVQWW